MCSLTYSAGSVVLEYKGCLLYLYREMPNKMSMTQMCTI
jgi:hypothetical protein